MVLIAIDKHSRKILGYLCRNDQNVAYCCGECDFEFTTAQALEEHMFFHETLVPSTPEVEQPSCFDDDVPLNILSNTEREKQLQVKYQVTPCSVQLFRFDTDDDDSGDNDLKMDMDMDMDIDLPTMNNTNEENIAPTKEQSPEKRPGPASRVKKHKDAKKLLKKPLAPPAVCVLCGKKFHSIIAMEHHQKTHIQSNINSPVFPCNVCGKNVNNLKKHLRHHKIENQNRSKTKKNDVPAEITVKNKFQVFESVETTTLNDTKVEEASSSTDAIIRNVPDDKEPGITSNGITSLPPHEGAPKSPSIVLPIVIEEFPIMKDFDSDPESERFLVAAATDDVLQTNKTNSDVVSKRFVKSQPNSDRKVQCEHCNKLVGLSYKRIHVKRYHSNIPVEIKL